MNPTTDKVSELHFLSEGFRYPDEAWGCRFSRLANDRAGKSRILPAFQPEELAPEHFRLFGPAPACPQELSLHLAVNPFEQARIMADMAGFYRAFGVEPEAGERPDNLSVALSFLSLLTLKERNAVEKNREEARHVTAKAAGDFAREFLSPGIAAFSAKLPHTAPHPFYQALTDILRREVFAIQPPARDARSHWEPRPEDAEEGEPTCGLLKPPLPQ